MDGVRKIQCILRNGTCAKNGTCSTNSNSISCVSAHVSFGAYRVYWFTIAEQRTCPQCHYEIQLRRYARLL